MKRDFRLYLQDILDSIDLIEDYVRKEDEDSFSGNYELQDAVIRRFEIIGEAAKKIPEEIKRKYHKVPWRMISGMRDVLIHEYFEVSVNRVWKTIKKDLPALKTELKRIK